ncbi:MAG: hypothetical protein LBI77_03570 [Puniceicoccales bacterium]|jgi:hypothetical protein|nr:hypothetical protein [Puniceicoccales bacterium]
MDWKYLMGIGYSISAPVYGSIGKSFAKNFTFSAKVMGKNETKKLTVNREVRDISKEKNSTTPSPSKKENSPLKLIPDGYKLQDVPGNGLCGYWAILIAEKAKNLKNEISIKVTKMEVKGLLRRLSDRVAYTVKKENKTTHEVEMVEEIDQIIRDHYAKNFEDLYQKIEAGSMQLNSPLTIFLAQEMGCNIVIKSERKEGGKVINDTNFYDSGNENAKEILIHYSGNGSSGHYQAIIAKNKNVQCIYN